MRIGTEIRHGLNTDNRLFIPLVIDDHIYVIRIILYKKGVGFNRHRNLNGNYFLRI